MESSSIKGILKEEISHRSQQIDILVDILGAVRSSFLQDQACFNTTMLTFVFRLLCHLVSTYMAIHLLVNHWSFNAFWNLLTILSM